MKITLKEYFDFTRRNRNAAFILLGLIAALVILPYFIPQKKLDIHIDAALQRELDSFKTTETNQYNFVNNTAFNTDTTGKDTIKKSLFVFDPNTLSAQGFMQLGLSPKVVHTLINYRNKGGYFKSPEDLRKIYGLSKAEADKLIPYVRIQSTSPNFKQKDDVQYEKPTASSSTHQYKKININTATAEDWKAFPGIGDAIANRIIKFRTSMGGFKSVDQVGKTYGLNDSVFQKIKPYLILKDSVNN